MMDCITFSKYIKDYIAEEMSEESAKEMLIHLNQCKECRRYYEEHMRSYKYFEGMFIANDHEFKSSRIEILNSINKNKYSKKYFNKLIFFIRRNYKWYASSIAVLILLIFISSFTLHYIKNWKETVPASPGPSTNITSPTKEEIMVGEETITKFINKYYIVTKEDVALTKKMHSGMTEAESRETDEKMFKYTSEMSEMLTENVLVAFTADRRWFMRASTVKDVDHTMEVMDLVITEMPKKDDKLAFQANFTLIKKSFSGEILAEAKVSKKYYLTKENGKWKLTNPITFSIDNGPPFKNF